MTGSVIMADTVRCGISITSTLLDRFDNLIEKQVYSNRSEAIRDLIRDKLVETEWEEKDHEIVGAITIIYSHETRELLGKLLDLQHHNFSSIIFTIHVHLNEQNCLEVMVARGRVGDVKGIAYRLISTKGVNHGELTMTSLGDSYGKKGG